MVRRFAPDILEFLLPISQFPTPSEFFPARRHIRPTPLRVSQIFVDRQPLREPLARFLLVAHHQIDPSQVFVGKFEDGGFGRASC